MSLHHLLELQKQAPDSPALRKAIAEKSGAKILQAPASREHKYGVSAADERTHDGIVFASKLELNLYKFLRDRQVPFERQPEFVLEDGFEYDGKRYRAVKYIADFLVDPQGKRLVVDAKGVRTRLYELKQKLMLKKFGITVHCPKTLSELAGLLHDNGLLCGSKT